MNGLFHCRLKHCELFGPTNFAPVINTTVTIARQFQNGRHYFVLLIITDGVISDMKLTKRAIINASSLPISIIIGKQLQFLISINVNSFKMLEQFGSISISIVFELFICLWFEISLFFHSLRFYYVI